MVASSWISRLRSRSKPIYNNLRSSLSSINRSSVPSRSITSDVVASQRVHRQSTSSWGLSPWLSLAVAVSAGSVTFQFHPSNSASLCEPPTLDQADKSIGGKDSTEYVVEGSHKEVPRELIDELSAICKDDMTLDYEERYYHGKPQNSFHQAVNVPDVIVFPRSEEEVSKIVMACNKYKVPIVPYGGATSIEGHTLSPYGGVCIDMTLMKV